jgi:modulator of FtsH protease HflK
MIMTGRTEPGAQPDAMRNEGGGPWGSSGGKGGDSGGDGGGAGPRNPWNQPPGGGRPQGPRGPSVLDNILGQLRDLFGGRFPGPGANAGLWKIAAVAAAALWLIFTSVHLVAPEEAGIVTRFGKYQGRLEPGVSLTLPAPIDQVQTVDVQEIKSISIPDPAGEKLVLTGDQNIIDLAYSVRWSVRDPELYKFQLAEPDQTIQEVAESSMRAVVATVSLKDAIGPGRSLIEAKVQEKMQQLLDFYRSGVRIQGIAINKADPPAKVNDAFKEVSAAQQKAETYINQANAYAQTKVAQAQGAAAAFDKVYGQYKLAPDVTRRRMYYETMERVLSNSDKTIVETPGVTPYLPLPELKRRPEPAAPEAGQ